MNNPRQMPLLDQAGARNKASWFVNALDGLHIKETPNWADSFGDALRKWNLVNNVTPIRTLSLFSGGGGLDIGFHDAGFEIIECNELEEAFAATLIENSKKGSRLEGTKVVCMDIHNYVPPCKDIDFIIGGPPCQTFSAAGARAAGVNGTDDDRGNLFKEYVRILIELRPRGFLFENVYRIVGAQGGKPWAQIQQAFQNVGYSLYWRILDAADYGVPQFRERLIIVGLKNGSYQFPYPSHGPDSTDNHAYFTAGKAIRDVNSKIANGAIGGRHGYLLKDIPPGLNYSFYTEKLGHPKPVFGWRSKFSDYLYKADPDTPVRTIKAQGGQYTGPFHWENRTFTIEELKRLQTFPDDYTIVGKRQKIIHQLGNSVPPQLARILALSILQQVFNRRLPFYLQTMPDFFKLGFRSRKRGLTKIYAKKAAEAISCIDVDLSSSPYEGKGTLRCNITSDFKLRETRESDSSCYILKHLVKDGSWNLSCYEDNVTNQAKYEIIVLPSNKNPKNGKIDSILLRSFSGKHESILALWKYLEKLIKKHEHKDDLVQFFGYYQYKKKYTVNMNILDSSLACDLFWEILLKITNGHRVGKIISVTTLARCYNIPTNKLLNNLIQIKSIGFEIRNHNTNKQIKKDMVLIPYSFPSLNERSLQRLTEL